MYAGRYFCSFTDVFGAGMGVVKQLVKRYFRSENLFAGQDEPGAGLATDFEKLISFVIGIANTGISRGCCRLRISKNHKIRNLALLSFRIWMCAAKKTTKYYFFSLYGFKNYKSPTFLQAGLLLYFV